MTAQRTSALAHNYHPLPVEIATGEGAWVTDVDGRRYLDLLAAYSAVNFGHGHPRADRRGEGAARPRHARQPRVRQRPARAVRPRARRARRQADGAADEHGRRGRRVRHQGRARLGLPGEGGRRTAPATIVVASGNFHGRTTTIVSFSDDPSARDGFGPYTPGFRIVPYGSRGGARGRDRRHDRRRAARADAGRGRRRRAARRLPARRAPHLRRAPGADDRRRDPVGPRPRRRDVRVRPRRRRARPLPARQGARRRHRAGVRGRRRTRDVLGVLRPGEHGSTFGGNPLAAAVGLEVVRGCSRRASRSGAPASSARCCERGSSRSSATA